MHSIYTTPGFMIDSRPYGEAGKILYIFTRDLGLISAVAQGIRFEKSKLRYYVQNYSFATYSLVRGKEFWRLTSAAAEEEVNFQGTTPVSIELLAKLAALLKRLLQGEEAHSELFELVKTCATFLHTHTSPELTEEHMRSLESLTVLRILHSLGYVGTEAQFAPHLASQELTTSILDLVTPMRPLINRHINTALKESHL